MSSLYNKVAWSEGMLLKPQHFQQQERYLESRLSQSMQWLRPFYWGFYHLELDDEALSTGKISIKEAKGIFKNGTLFNIPHQDKAPEALDVSFCSNNSSLYLSMASDSENLIDQYEGIEVEINDAQNEVIQYASIKLNQLKLSLTSLASSKHALEFARIQSIHSDNSIHLDENFSAPLLQIKASTQIMSQLKNCMELIHLKIKMSEYNTGSLSSYYPYLLKNHTHSLRHLLNIQNLHPEEVYRILLEISSQLSLIHQDESFDPPEYQHENIYESLNYFFESIKQNINKSLGGSNEIELTKHQDGFWLAPFLNDEALSQSLILSLRFQNKPTLSPSELINHLKLGPKSIIRSLIKQALPGIKLKPVDLRSQPKNNEYSYEIIKQGELWALITEERNLVIHGTNRLEQSQLSLSHGSH